jgi:hypothetical protein
MKFIPVKQYNYEIFSVETAMPLLRFDQSPAIGKEAPDFPLWDLAGGQTSLKEVWSKNLYTIVEFGSFT